MDYLESLKTKNIENEQRKICEKRLNNLLSNGIKWIEVADIHISFDHFSIHCDRVYFTNGGISVASVPISKLFCAVS